MNDALSLSDVPRTFTVQGRDYKVAPFTVADMGRLQDWVNCQFPDPYEVVQREINRRGDTESPMPISQQQFLLRVATEEACKGKNLLGTDEANAKAWSNEGIKEIAFLSISKADPLFTRKDAEELYCHMGMTDMYRLMDLTMVNRVIGDPKAETNGEATSPNKSA